MVEACIFDLDGVLVHTVELHFRAWWHLAHQHKLAFTAQQMEGFRGRHRRDCLLELFAPRALTETEIDAYLRVKDAHYHQQLAQAAPDELLIPHARHIVEALKSRGLKLGVASSSTNAEHVLKQVGLYDLLDVVASGNTVSRTKPKPDVFIWAAGALRTSPRQAIVFEDAAAGIHAAKTAGMFVVGIGGPPATTEAHIVFDSMQAVDLDAVFSAAQAWMQQATPSQKPLESS